MTRPGPLDRQLAELFGKYVRAIDGIERQQLGALLDALAPKVFTSKEQPDEQQPADRLTP